MKLKHYLLKLLSALLCAALIICCVPMTAFAADGVAINQTNFPDANFREYVSSNFDKNKNGSLSETEIAAVTDINLYFHHIKSLEGIEYLTELKRLEASDNAITHLDLSKNPKLVSVYCYLNKIKSLTLGNNPELKNLDCSYNSLTSLDLSSCTNLTYLNCATNKLTTLNLSNNLVIEEVGCSENALTSLDLGAGTSLKVLNCSENALTSLDLGAGTSLKALDCSENKFVSLDLRAYSSLEELYCQKSSLTSLYLNKSNVLKKLDCSENQLTSLDLSYNYDLKYTPSNTNSYPITVKSDRKFDLSTLPVDFDLSRVKWFISGTVDGNILTVFNGTKKVRYIYDLGNGDCETFTLSVTEEPDYKPCDVNMNGTLSIDDATEIQKYIAGMTSFDETQKQLADVNGDSSIDVADATAIQKYIAGMTSFDETQKQLADVNGDSKINISDATEIQKLIAG